MSGMQPTRYGARPRPVREVPLAALSGAVLDIPPRIRMLSGLTGDWLRPDDCVGLGR